MAGVGVFIIGGIVAVLDFLWARFWKEALLIYADIGDATVDANANSRAMAVARGIVP